MHNKYNARLIQVYKGGAITSRWVFTLRRLESDSLAFNKHPLAGCFFYFLSQINEFAFILYCLRFR